MNKITLEQLFPYLPYSVQYLHITPIFNVEEYGTRVLGHSGKTIPLKAILYPYDVARFLKSGEKLVLKPISNYEDITAPAMQELNIDIMDQIEISDFAQKRISIDSLHYGTFKILCENHVDIFGLIDANLAERL